MGRDYAGLFAPLLEVGEDHLAAGLRLFETVESLGAFDAVLAAAAIASGADALVSADRTLTSVPGVRVLDPAGPELVALLDPGT